MHGTRTSRVVGHAIWTVGVVAAALGTGRALAGERHFTYAYESTVLPPGATEMEPWTTVRVGRDEFYLRFDHRLEYEVGVARRLQAAFYFNWHAVTQGAADARTTAFEWSGVSMEWKYKLLDPVADPVGLALYFEPALGPSEGELEAKAIFDKRIGSFLAAVNLVGESEAEWGGEETEREGAVEVDVGMGQFLTPSFFVGVEGRNHNEIVEGEGLEHAALHAGPVVHWTGRRWWATLTGMAQLPALAGSEDGALVLDEHERFEARLLLGMDL